MIPRGIFDEYLKRKPDKEKLKAIDLGPDDPIYIVAGPGSGKTTVLTVRILKLILVDGVDPSGILATTFTKKAASELRSRILGNGFELITNLLNDSRLTSTQKEWLRKLDINQVITGTIDSICEQLIRDYREPGMQPPILADEFITSTLMLREGLLEKNRYKENDLYNFVAQMQGSRYDISFDKKVNILNDIWNRRFNDQINWSDFISDIKPSEGNLRNILHEALSDYEVEMQRRGMVDFTMLENDILLRLRNGGLTEFTDKLKVIMVDEYQDTNLLQESIYFELAKRCNGTLIVVGDDDQSLYGFRGATVELFSDFEKRYYRVFNRRPEKVFLATNYRSTKAVIKLVNNYALLDEKFQEVRVQQKPQLTFPSSAEEGLPVLAMFRKDIDTLSADISKFINDVFNGTGFKLPNGEIINCDDTKGNLGDCAVLCSSPGETKKDGTLRLPGHLREKLEQLNIEMFNPRGENLANLESVQVLGGLLLECLDPDSSVQFSTRGLSDDILETLNVWRIAANTYLNGATCPASLINYCEGWKERNPRRTGYVWPENISVLDLLYNLAHWFPEFYTDPEGQIYLEVFTRQFISTQTLGSFKGNIVTMPNNKELSDHSVREIIRNVIVPIASGTIKVNEELIESFPRDRVSILSIHQSKGLEFPLVIVDVGSDFKNNHASHAFKRFPAKGGITHNVEDFTRSYSSLNVIRSGKDRAYDDLYRQYFVAFSRAQSILLLVGLDASAPKGSVNTVTTGTDRKGRKKWEKYPFTYI